MAIWVVTGTGKDTIPSWTKVFDIGLYTLMIFSKPGCSYDPGSNFVTPPKKTMLSRFTSAVPAITGKNP